jgi:hypothetical protein
MVAALSNDIRWRIIWKSYDDRKLSRPYLRQTLRGIPRQGVKIARSPISASQTANPILVVNITSTNPCERLSLCAVLFAPA